MYLVLVLFRTYQLNESRRTLLEVNQSPRNATSVDPDQSVHTHCNSRTTATEDFKKRLIHFRHGNRLV